MAVVVAAVEQADRHRHGADLQRAEEGDGEDGRVVEDEQHAVLAAHSELSQQVPRAVDLPAQPLVGQRRSGAT